MFYKFFDMPYNCREVKAMESKATEQVCIRIAPEFRAKIRAEADRQARTEANMIKAILAAYFNDMDRVKKIAETR